MPIKSERLLAIEILKNLVSGKGSLSTQIAGTAAANPTSNLALIREYTFGVCRQYHQLAFFASQLLTKPLRHKDTDVFCLILLGLYQLFHMRTPDHAAINESVALTHALKKSWAKNLVNAVLRQAQRDRETLAQAAAKDPQARVSHPRWLIDAITRDWPVQADTILVNNNRQAPMTLRTNLQKTDRSAYQAQLADAGIPAMAGTRSKTAIVLDSPMDVASLPGFDAGLVSVQDEASQLAAPLLNPARGNKVLDACAAPGGKTCALLEFTGNLQVLALDNSETRLARVRENLTRLGLQASIVCADATDTATWWDGVPFDCILLDAPCSGTGVIRRHPDIKLLRQEQAVTSLAELQHQLLCALWGCLKPGGRLLYSTCSVLRAENEHQINRFLATTADAEALPLGVPGALDCSVGIQFLPGISGTDGFYYALLKKAQKAPT